MIRVRRFGPARVVAAATWLGVGTLLAAPQILNFLASPGTISFTSTDPNSAASGSSSATTTFTIKKSKKNAAWSMSVATASSTMTNCSWVAVSDITTTCSSVNITGGGYLGTGGCASASSLSTTPAVIASGLQGDGDQSYTVVANYVLTDRWRHKGAISPACTQTLTYTLAVEE
jgi:hypothetical protein